MLHYAEGMTDRERIIREVREAADMEHPWIPGGRADLIRDAANLLEELARPAPQLREIPDLIISMTWVGGRPRTKGSLNAYCSKGRDHKLVWREQVKDSKAWRMTMASQLQREARAKYGEHLLLEIPLELRLVYFFSREQEDKSTEPYPTAMTVGDLDKLDRNVLDALTSSGIIKDDRFIVRIMSEKRWGNTPGVQISLMQIPEGERAETWQLLSMVPVVELSETWNTDK